MEVAKTLLTIAMIDSKLGMLPDALTHARRSRDLFIFAPHSSGADREKARELVMTLEASIEKQEPQASTILPS